ncbi:MAG TPA: GNAT family N-acetyltransferase [Gemmatimonadales bacterium]|nr:GNAT family N-acetyltransferase [Gemmatimonadales bacterium]
MLIIESMHPADWRAVRRIYAEGQATGRATFDTDIPEWDAWDAGHLGAPRLVAREEGEVVGWAALGPVSSRACYRGVAEVSIYVAGAAQGRGAGRMLLEALVSGSEAAGIWTLYSSIHADNSVSVRLHQRAGFRVVGRRERIARRADGWADTIIMERRSSVVGL